MSPMFMSNGTITSMGYKKGIEQEANIFEQIVQGISIVRSFWLLYCIVCIFITESYFIQRE